MLKIIESKALANIALTKDEAQAILSCPNENLLDLVSVAQKAREKYCGKKVKLNYLVNVKSGICPEDCHYCSQSKDSKAPIEKYGLMKSSEIISHTENGMAVGAVRACLVASGRGPSDKEMDDFCESVEELKKQHPSIEICACLGLLKQGQAEQLKKSGVYAYNHNINTSKSHYEKICGTHDYDDRLDTLNKAQTSGLSACSGVLSGMGETDEDLIEMAMTLREKKAESIPINFLIPIDETPLEGTFNLTPEKCLKILALFRLMNPTAEIRIAGGREINLRTLQPLGLMIANSIFVGDYLTTKGQSAMDDLQMIYDLGYTVLGQPDDFLEGKLGKIKPQLKNEKIASSKATVGSSS